MGKTLSDIHRERYDDLIDMGMTHEEAINTFPKQMRSQVEKEIEMSDFESHFGMKFGTFVVLMTIVTVVILSLLT